MNQKKYEQRALVIGIIVNIAMGVAGVWIYHITRIGALFLDAYFTLVAVLSGIVATIISRYSKRTGKAFPHGHFMLEPLYAILKSLLTIGLLIYATISVSVKAIDYFLHGIGEEMLLGPVIPYEIVMVILCIALSLFYRHQNKRINNTSTMLKAETKTTLVDGIMSGGIGVSALIVSFIDGSSPLYFLRYTGDFFITIILVLFSIRVPVKVLMKSFIELANGVVTDEKMKRPIEQVIRKHLPMDTELKNCDIYKTGMSLRIFVYLDDHIDILCLNALREKMQQMKKELSVEYENISICFAITTPN